MIVIDASAMVEALVGTDPNDALVEALEEDVHAPALLDVEVMSVLRGLELGRVVSRSRASLALADYGDLQIIRHELEPVADRVWELRHQFTSYDAFYVALAEALDSPLITCDRKLNTSGHTARVQVLGRSTPPRRA